MVSVSGTGLMEMNQDAIPVLRDLLHLRQGLSV